MSEKKQDYKFDFRPLGNAIKTEREKRHISRDKFSERIDRAARHLQAIENDGQHPSLDLLIEIVTFLDISVDEYIYGRKVAARSSARRRVDSILDKLDDRELAIVEATANSLLQSKVPAE